MSVLGTNWKTNLGAIGIALGVASTVLTQVSEGTFTLDSGMIAAQPRRR